LRRATSRKLLDDLHREGQELHSALVDVEALQAQHAEVIGPPQRVLRIGAST
jgi:hypothetical protein